MYYVQRGSVPQQRHTQHRAPDGSLYAEELFGVEGFTGRSSLLYHLTPPTQTHRVEPVSRVRLEAADDGLHRHRLTKTGAVEPDGDIVTGRTPLYFNNDVVFGVVRPSAPMREGTFYRNGIADEMLFVHEGTGVCDTVFGPLPYGPGDYLVLPIGTTWRLDPDEGSAQRILYLEAPSEIEPPKLTGEHAMTVVVAAHGYPGTPTSGGSIREIEAAEQVEGVTVFHAGTALADNRLVAKGGRVLAVTAVADTFANARARAYRAVDQIDFADGFHRRDIGWRELARETA